MPEISAIIPTHYRPELLGEAIASVAAQQLRPAELIIVDDADDAPSRQVVAQAASWAPFPIRYLANVKGGVCWSRNLGAEMASRPLLAFLDDDDQWHPNFLRKLHDRLVEADAELALSGLLRHEQGQPPRPRAQPTTLHPGNVLHQPGSMTGSNLLIRRDVFLAAGGFDPAITVFNDWDLFVRLIDRGIRYVVVEEVLAEWRQHEGQRIATPSLRRADGIAKFLERYRERLSPSLYRDIKTTELGIRRAYARGPGSRLVLSVWLALAHGPRNAVRRIARRFVPSRS